MTYNSESQVYYYKFLELQEKLRRSEEDRLKLEIKLNEMVQRNREEEQQYYKTLKSQYKDFIKYDAHRMLRNEQILQALEKIERKISLLSSKTERFKALRQHYQAYLDRTNSSLRGKSNVLNVSNPSEQKKVTENLKSSSMPEEIRRDDSFNHNYVYNYLKKNLQPSNSQQNATDSMLNCPGKVVDFNESLPPLYSFSQTKMENPKNVSNYNEDRQETQHVDVKQNISFPNDHYNEKWSPPNSPDEPQSYMNSGLYNNQPITSLEIQGKQSSSINFPRGCGNTFDKQLFSSDDHLKNITPDIHIRNIDSFENSLHPNTQESQIKPIQIERNNYDFNHDLLLDQIRSSKETEQCERNNEIISDNKPFLANKVNDNLYLDSVAKEFGDSKYMKKEEKCRLQIPELSTEPSIHKVQLNHSGMIRNVHTHSQTKSMEHTIQPKQLRILNSQNSQDQMIVPDQKTSDYQVEDQVIQKNSENNAISYEIVPNVTITQFSENKFNQDISSQEDITHDGNLSNDEYVPKAIQPAVENADFNDSHVEPFTTYEEITNQHESDISNKIEIENVPNHSSKISQINASEQPTGLGKPEQDVTVQNSELQFENQKYDEEAHNAPEANRNYESTDQVQVYDENCEQDLSANLYSQYSNDGQLLNDGQPELTQYETENVPDMPTDFGEHIQDETVLALQSNVQYEEEQVNNSKEIGNIEHSNQNFDPNIDYQTYADNNEQYLPSDQYPQYGQNEGDYDQNIAQNLDENQLPYNMQYNEKDLAYMTYDETNQGYNQQYYEHEANYGNYENGGQEYDQNQYDQYNQESYPPEQHIDYEGQDQEPLDTNLATSGANYPEAEYNTDGLCQDFDKVELEPVAQPENHGTENVTNLVNILETDSENTTDKSDVKVSNESDFDFSVTQ